MIEVVFSESAYGSLKVAQHYGVGKYHGAATSVFLRGQGGAEPTKAQMQEAQKRAEERAQRDWENAIPLGGRQEDLYFISLAWSVGEISENGIGFQRREVMEKIYGCLAKRECSADDRQETSRRPNCAGRDFRALLRRRDYPGLV